MTEVTTEGRVGTDPPAARPVRNRWRNARLIGVHPQSRHSRTLTFRVPDWPGHLPGQHVDVRLTAPDGYSAQRSYSLAEVSMPNRLAITVDLLPHGEVSSYLVEAMEIGDELDVRGPIGGWFVWNPGEPDLDGGPVLLIGGGSGVVPLVTMLQARVRAADRTPMMLVYSVRSPRELMYGPELADLAAAAEVSGTTVRLVYTRRAPSGYPRSPARLAAADIQPSGRWPQPLAARVYVCGPSGFVDHATGLLREVGYPDESIRIERFGATGADS